ncbi:phage tail protein [Deinococcus radiotolerans]|uniref:Tail Collar domain-containing protein n=1 Tax=Deinococcus radiotolerans TaxID=1309407 RepID=A0ABQ2FRD6_9DEIO|nr:tail fiber protein [Deinococcus radiotolerans]GGL19404.1 tail Collar domain-containing protein [Deinococcus radiotolerans]
MTPHIGEIRLFAGSFEPDGWMFCMGQLVPIEAYDLLFNLIGTTYGGDGETTFALPDLRSRVPVHQGNGYEVAQSGGAEQVTLKIQQIPGHSHVLQASTNLGSAVTPSGNVLAQTAGGIQLYYEGQASEPLAPQAALAAGDSQPHTNLQPYLAMNFIISLSGLFPSPT